MIVNVGRFAAAECLSRLNKFGFRPGIRQGNERCFFIIV